WIRDQPTGNGLDELLSTGAQTGVGIEPLRFHTQRGNPVIAAVLVSNLQMGYLELWVDLLKELHNVHDPEVLMSEGIALIPGLWAKWTKARAQSLTCR